MTTIESKKVEIERPTSELYTFIRNLNNFEQLLPKERISDFKSDGDSCSFKISGMATIELAVKEEYPSERLLLGSKESPFDFTLDIRIEDIDGHSRAYQIAELDLKPMMKMMVQKPLTNLFDHISDRLKTIHS